MNGSKKCGTHTHTHTHTNYLAIKNNKNFPFAPIWVDLEGVILNEMSDREIQMLCDVTYMRTLNKRGSKLGGYNNNEVASRVRRTN